MYKVARFATANLLREGAPEGQADGVTKNVRICKSPKIDVTSISSIYHHVKFALQMVPTACKASAQQTALND